MVDCNGNPVKNAHFRVKGFTQSTSDVDPSLKAAGDFNLQRSEIEFGTTTNDGTFRIPNMPQDYRLAVTCRGQTGEFGSFFIDTGKGEFETIKYRHPGTTELRVHRTPITVSVTQRPWVRIRVQDHNGNLVSGGNLYSADNHGHFHFAELGSDGKRILRGPNPGLHRVYYASDS